MIRLFSPFDLFYFSKVWVGIFIMVYSIINFFFPFSSTLYFISSFNKNLGRFFYSLKVKIFNKSSLFHLIVLVTLLFFLNFSSVFSFVFPLTSQVRLVLFFSLFFWGRIFLFRLSKTIKKVLLHFIPEGAPLGLAVLLFLIEVIRCLIRPITLIVRLVANILAGHLLLRLLSKLVFLFSLSYASYLALNIVELIVALIQSYIFIVIVSLYFSEI